MALCALAGSAQAHAWIVGPGDTLKFPLELRDSIGNPTAVDSAADSVLVRVIKNFAANASGADTCYLNRGLMDASTNTLLHTTGNATTTIGLGQTPKRLQTFSFFATAYALTNSATASGTYTVEVWTYDHSMNLITTDKYTLNYVYQVASTYTFAMWADSLMIGSRFSARTIPAKLDTALIASGWSLVSSFRVKRGADYDTLLIDTNNALWRKEVFKHIGGQPGGRPDSGRALTP
jgi:hypothetical protein